VLNRRQYLSRVWRQSPSPLAQPAECPAFFAGSYRGRLIVRSIWRPGSTWHRSQHVPQVGVHRTFAPDPAGSGLNETPDQQGREAAIMPAGGLRKHAMSVPGFARQQDF
jgi:hypothetical protein